MFVDKVRLLSVIEVFCYYCAFVNVRAFYYVLANKLDFNKCTIRFHGYSEVLEKGIHDKRVIDVDMEWNEDMTEYEE